MVSVQRHLALLRGMIAPDERERLWLRVERLLFSGLGFVQQAQQAWPLAAVRDVAVEPGPGRHAHLTCTVLGLPERFAGKQPELEAVAAGLGAAMSGEGAQRSAGLVAELERLAALRDAGTLTEAEFQGAKQRLLE